MPLLDSLLQLIIAPAHAGSFASELDRAITRGRDFFGLSGLGLPFVFVNIGNFLIGLIAAIALAAIVWGGVMYILSLGDESRSARAKNIILFAVVGLLVAGSSSLVYNLVRCNLLLQCTPVSALTISSFIFRIVSILLIPAGAIAFGALVYGGYLYMTSLGDESRASRAKNTIFYALLGLLVIGIAGIVINVVIGLL